jgi:hypothetical protein
MTYIPYIGAFISIISIIAMYFGFILKLGREIDAVDGKINSLMDNHELLCKIHTEQLGLIPEMQQQLRDMKSGQDIFWKVLDPHLAGIIHSPVHYTRDVLVDKLLSRDITREECFILDVELENMLEEKDLPADKRLAAALLLARLRQNHLIGGLSC